MIPKQMTDVNQWVVWRLEVVNNRNTKVPYTTNGTKASTINPATWCSFNDAMHYVCQGRADGVGFVFTKNDDFIGIDWDHCIDATGAIKTEVYNEVKAIGSYAEFSPSGTGIHVICKGTVPVADKCRGNDREVYDRGRFFTVTGKHVEGTPTEVLPYYTDALLDVYRKMGTKKASVARPTSFKYSPIKSFSTEDAKDVFKSCATGSLKEKFKTLMSGDISGYPSQSEADLALCKIIAIYTDNPLTIDYIFRNSKLMRDKWDRQRNGTSYGNMTVHIAVHDRFMNSLRMIIEADDES